VRRSERMIITYDELLPAVFYRFAYEIEIPALIGFVKSEFGVALEYKGDSLFEVVSGDVKCLKPDIDEIDEVISILQKQKLEKDVRVISTWVEIHPEDFTEEDKYVLHRIGKRLSELT
jgi:hypothetical protein